MEMCSVPLRVQGALLLPQPITAASYSCCGRRPLRACLGPIRFLAICCKWQQGDMACMRACTSTLTQRPAGPLKGRRRRCVIICRPALTEPTDNGRANRGRRWTRWCMGSRDCDLVSNSKSTPLTYCTAHSGRANDRGVVGAGASCNEGDCTISKALIPVSWQRHDRHRTGRPSQEHTFE